MSTLAEIVELDGEILSEKFGLEPRFCCSPNESDNLLHLSPIILLEDLELRDGGFKDTSAKDVLSRVAKHICDSKDPSLFQIPEIPAFHMGYAKRSENKKRNMSIDHEEAKIWMSYLNLSRFNQDSEGEESHEPTSSDEEMDIDPPTAQDTPNQDDKDLVSPHNSGLKFPLKGSHILLFSILLIFFDKKKKKANSTRSNEDEPKIGANKVSDFLLFWIIPYLLSYTQKKVREIVKHHQEHNRREFRSTCKKSSFDVIKEAMSTCGFPAELKTTISSKYKDFYGTEQLEYEYDLLKSPENTPVILVPKRYKVTQMPVELEDIGNNWRELGDITLTRLFVSKFIRNRDIQRDFFFSFPLLTNRQGVDYAIILPDEETFLEVISDLEETSRDIFIPPKVYPKGGRDIIVPSIGLVTTRDKHLSVCFSYFQGTGGGKVAALFRAIGAHYHDHFSLVILPGLCKNDRDPDCKVGSLYPVSSIRMVTFKGKYPELVEKTSFSASQGKFCLAEFPETYKLWQREVKNNDSVMKLMTETKRSLQVDPKYEQNAPLVVEYSKKCHGQRLKSVPFGATTATSKKSVRKYMFRAVNLNGCLLNNLEKSGRRGNTAVVLCIEDTCGNFGSCLPTLSKAIQVIKVNFVRAVVAAGLPKVYPFESDDKDRDEIESGSREEEDEEEESSEDEPSASGPNPAGDDQEFADFYASQQPSSSGSGRPQFKQGTPSDYELERLASGLGDAWKKLGRRLKIQDPKLDDLNKLNEDLSEKGYKTLRHWKEVNGSAATYEILGHALLHGLVNRRDLAEEFCYEKH